MFFVYMNSRFVHAGFAGLMIHYMTLHLDHFPFICVFLEVAFVTLDERIMFAKSDSPIDVVVVVGNDEKVGTVRGNKVYICLCLSCHFRGADQWIETADLF